MRRAIVIGAGIGGLTAALALAAECWDVHVVERAPELGAVGSCVMITPNALRALDAIPGGVADDLRSLAPPPALVGMRTTRGDWLRTLRHRYGDVMVPVERPVLIDLLAARLQPGVLRLGAEVVSVDPEAGEVCLVSGEILQGDLVVAADGMHSPTRRRLFPGHPDPEFVGVTCWLLLVHGDGLEVTPGEIWGRGAMFGTFPLADGRVYAFGERLARAGYRPRPAADEKAELARTFAAFPEPVGRIIERADPAEVLRVDIHSQRAPLPAFDRGRVALLGDAAHTMTPNAGQGACQAMEDAVVLARFAHDLPRYTATRRNRVRRIQRIAATATRLSTARGALAVVRDAGMRAANLLPPAFAASQADAIFRWAPPQEAVP